MNTSRRDFIKAATAATMVVPLLSDHAFGLGKSIPIQTRDMKSWSVEALLAGKTDTKIKTIETFTKGSLSLSA